MDKFKLFLHLIVVIALCTLIIAISGNATANTQHINLQLEMPLTTLNNSTQNCELFNDEFGSPELNSNWFWLNENPQNWNLNSTAGQLQINTLPGDIYRNYESVQNLLIQDTPSGDFELTTKVSIDPTRNWQQGGIIVYDDNDNYVKIVRIHSSTYGGSAVEFAFEIGGSFTLGLYSRVPQDLDTLHLKLIREQTTFSAFYSADGESWNLVGQPKNLSLNGNFAGLIAIGSYSSPPVIPAEFDYFQIKQPCLRLSLPIPHQQDDNGLDQIWTFFDHEFPMGYFTFREPIDTRNSTLLYTGDRRAGTIHHCVAGSSCYSAHEGIDFSIFTADQRDEGGQVPVLAASTGTLTARTENCGGNIVEIINGRYKTKYLHLAPDSHWTGVRSCTENTPCEIIEPAIRIGSVGNTGNCTTGAHLHFEVMYDHNNDGVFTNTERVDPYGWHNPTADSDPWEEMTDTPSRWLWDFEGPEFINLFSGSEQTVLATENIDLLLPGGIVNSPSTLAFNIAPAPINSMGNSQSLRLNPSADTIGVGEAFQLTAVEIDGDSIASFNKPITILISYTDEEIKFGQEDTMSIYRWKIEDSSWENLETNLNFENNSAQVATNQPGIFSLRSIPKNSKPTISQISSGMISNQEATIFSISGENFIEGATANLGITSLSIQFISSTSLEATIPAGTVIGNYELMIQNPDGQRAVLTDAIEIVGPVYLPIIISN